MRPANDPAGMVTCFFVLLLPGEAAEPLIRRFSPLFDLDAALRFLQSLQSAAQKQPSRFTQSESTRVKLLPKPQFALLVSPPNFYNLSYLF